MADDDVTDLLTNTFTGLQLFAIPRAEPWRHFGLFPELPIELRLKIFTHALPIPSVLDVNAKIVVSDPSFGLYLTFSIPTGRGSRGNPGRKLAPANERRSPKQSRILSLLSACTESREAYLSAYSIALPYEQETPSGCRRGTLYVSKMELLHWQKLDDVIIHADFQRAIVHDYRLQDFWSQIENLAMPIECFVLSTNGSVKSRGLIQLICLKMRSLKEVKGVMWKGFEALQDQPGKDMMENSMRRFMDGVESSLKEYQLETKDYRVPSFDIIF